MKKLMYLAGAIFALGLTLSSCNKKPVVNINDIVENGFYVVGDATGVKDLATQGAGDLSFGNGLNEVGQVMRDGMYEKYVVLEAGKEFEFIKKEGEKKISYGAQLAYGELQTEGQPIMGYKGSLVENVKMKVTETGLYHIVLDFNEDGALNNVGGAQVILAKVNAWGVRGGMNNWGFTEGKQEGYTWTWENQELSAGAAFKFDYSNGWKINLDDAGLVKANTNLGADCKQGGGDISVAEGGLYKITLAFNVKGGDIANSYTYTVEKTGEVAVKDYSNVELELVGDAIAEQEGAKADPSNWNWGNVISMGKPAVNGNVYTWTVNVNLLASGGFKARTINAEAQGDIQGFDLGIDGNNATVAADGNYNVVVTIDGKADTKKLEIFAGDAQGITITGVVPADWIKCNLWAWYKVDGVDTNVFAAWPGQLLVIRDGVVSYTFAPNVTEVYVIFNNGDGVQTNDLGPFTENTNIVIADNIKQ